MKIIEEEYWNLNAGIKITEYKIIQAYKNIIVVENHNKYGILELNSKVFNPELIVDFIYDGIQPFDYDRAIVKKNNCYGIIDNNGNIVVDIKYKDIIRENNYFKLSKQFIGLTDYVVDLNGKIVMDKNNYLCANFRYLFKNGDILVWNVSQYEIYHNDKMVFSTRKSVAVKDEEHIILYDDALCILYNRFTKESISFSPSLNVNSFEYIDDYKYNRAFFHNWQRNGMINEKGQIISYPLFFRSIIKAKDELFIYSSWDSVDSAYLEYSGVIDKFGRNIVYHVEENGRFSCKVLKHTLGSEFENTIFENSRHTYIDIKDNMILLVNQDESMYCILDYYGNYILKPMRLSSLHIYNKDMVIVNNLLINIDDIKILYKLILYSNDKYVTEVYFDDKTDKDNKIAFWNSLKFRIGMKFNYMSGHKNDPEGIKRNESKILRKQKEIKKD